MVLGYQYDVLHAGLLGGTHPLLGVYLRRAIGGCRLGAVGPFLVEERVYAEMYEHAILAVDLLTLCMAR